MTTDTQLTGADLIATERERQITSEGWTPEHDDAHDQAELVGAALTYLTRSPWPWFAAVPGDEGPDLAPVRTVDDLVKAGALIAAEIDRLQRAAR